MDPARGWVCDHCSSLMLLPELPDLALSLVSLQCLLYASCFQPSLAMASPHISYLPHLFLSKPSLSCPRGLGRALLICSRVEGGVAWGLCCHDFVWDHVLGSGPSHGARPHSPVTLNGWIPDRGLGQQLPGLRMAESRLAAWKSWPP